MKEENTEIAEFVYAISELQVFYLYSFLLFSINNDQERRSDWKNRGCGLNWDCFHRARNSLWEVGEKWKAEGAIIYYWKRQDSPFFSLFSAFPARFLFLGATTQKHSETNPSSNLNSKIVIYLLNCLWHKLIWQVLLRLENNTGCVVQVCDG